MKLVKRIALTHGTIPVYTDHALAIFENEEDAIKYAESRELSLIFVTTCYVKQEYADRFTLYPR